MPDVLTEMGELPDVPTLLPAELNQLRPRSSLEDMSLCIEQNTLLSIRLPVEVDRIVVCQATAGAAHGSIILTPCTRSMHAARLRVREAVDIQLNTHSDMPMLIASLRTHVPGGTGSTGCRCIASSSRRPLADI